MGEEEELVKAGWLRKKTKTKWKLCWYVLDMGDINNATFAHYEHKTMLRPRENDEAIDRLAQGARQIIPLSEITGLKHTEGTSEFTLDLSTNIEVALKAKSAEEAETWVKLLNSGFQKIADEHEKKYQAKYQQTKPVAKKKKKGSKGPKGQGQLEEFSEYRHAKLQHTLRPKKKNKGRGDSSTGKGKGKGVRHTEVFVDLPGPPKGQEQMEGQQKAKAGFENVVSNLVMKAPPPPAEDEYSELTPTPVVRMSRKGHVGSTVVMKQKEHLAKLGVLGRNAVLPVLAVSEADKLAQTGNTKTKDVEQLLRETLERSTSLTSLFKDLDAEALEKMVQDMYRVEVKEGDRVVEQGETGHLFYIVEKGYFYVLHLAQYNDEKLHMKKGEEGVVTGRGPRAFFGEMALLYEHPSTVSVKAVRDSVLWAISRKQFHEITMQSSRRQQEIRLRKLHTIEMINEMLTEKDIVALADAMETKEFTTGEVILDKGMAVESVYFVKTGRVGLFAETDDAEPEEELDDTVNTTYGALRFLEEFNSRHTLKALGPNTVLLTLAIKDAEGIVGSMRENLLNKFEEEPEFKTKIMAGIAKFKEDLEEITPEAAVKMTIAHFQKETVRVGTGTLAFDPERSQVGTEKFGGTLPETRVKGTEGPLPALDKEWQKAPAILPNVKFSDLKPIQILGSGNFGHVHLVKNKNSSLYVEMDGTKTKAPKQFALKVLSRDNIVVNGWEQMAMNEKCAMEELSYFSKSPFIVKLFHSFTDKRNIYFLLELCDYGDLYGHVKRRPGKKFKESTMRFYVAGVVKGLEAMHDRSIIYRDLKPENLMLDSGGYLKIGDFGLAKKTLRTFTVCGTPDYMAPETILSKGHDKGVDWWAVGVLVYEIGTGHTPFTGTEPLEIYEAVLGHRELHLPRGMYQGEDVTANCFDLMDLLLQPKKAKRLGNLREGAQGVIDHAWFHGFKWDDYLKRKMKAPSVKKHNNYKERSIYDPEFDAEEEDLSGWEPEVNTVMEETPTYV